MRFKRVHPNEFDFCPKTYVMPEDYRLLITDHDVSPSSLLIMKPVSQSCGRGITVLNQKSEVKRKPGFVVQQYLSPLLINGLKFDLRVYCLVTSYDPLKVYMFREGLVRFATQKYSQSKETLDQRYMHLTNYSVNKRSQSYNKADSQSESSKWSFAQLKSYFDKQGYSFSVLLQRISDIIVKTLLAIEPHVYQAVVRNAKRNAN